MGLYRSGGVYCTQCEADGFRRITYFLDRPDVMAVYTTRIEADAGGGAGAARQRQPRRRPARCPATERHFAVWHDPHPKPAYLFALVGGELGEVARSFYTTLGGRQVRARASMSSPARRRAPTTRSMRSSAPCAGTRRRSAANTISTSSTSSPCPTSTWARWRTRASTSSTTSTCWPRPRPRPMPTTPTSRRSSRMSISTTGPATASPAATGSSSA